MYDGCRIEAGTYTRIRRIDTIIELNDGKITRNRRIALEGEDYQ